ncbi:MerR family transcriptional regulator [Verrucomicrobiaceae bacterium 5K15]|uniref:MerR family transcriptional regulator n=1 Tax=Oceaniferula flava TaxID=2800421 RepID=A0AAE2VA98_9BACT|nr:MerR family transcriptional regulator [Oceaniferula flavus]MBK1856423.1 MerR family transcriptional regulator [Oceaniferula flavus]MBM1137730.1 MerR family transcriptional regulator [Oceaniferula flavus]
MNTHGIKAATALTGLSAHVIRVWEKRYAAVTPQRTETNRRLYTDDDIARLQTLAKLVQQGYAISNVAGLKDAELEEMLESFEENATEPNFIHTSKKSEPFVTAACEAIRDYDQESLEKVFDEATLSLGYSGLLEFVIIPTINRVGDDWNKGILTVAGEHASTSFIKDYLAHSVRAFNLDENAPVLVVTTPAGQIHDLGASIGACLARMHGWKTINLGASLPAGEIASALVHAKATALLLSIVYPIDDPMLAGELHTLRKLTPDHLPILVGGNSLDNYAKALEQINATLVPSITDLTPALQSIREKRFIASSA